MESSSVLESQEVEENGDLKELPEAYGVIDTNLKGTLNSKSYMNGGGSYKA